MTERRTYTAEQKAEALAMYPEYGAAGTSRALGIPKGTLMTWAYRAGVKSHVAETMRVAQAASHAAFKARMTELLAEVAELGSIRQIEILASDDAKLYEITGAVTRAIHDLQLLSGEATDRAEQVTEAVRTKALEYLDELEGDDELERRRKGAA